MEAPGANAPFSLKPIMFELEGVSYVGTILLVPLAELLAGRHASGGNGSIGGGGDSSGGGSGGDPKIYKLGAHWRDCKGAGAVRCAPARPVPLVWGEIADPPSGNSPSHSARPNSLQELAFLWVVLVGL